MKTSAVAAASSFLTNLALLVFATRIPAAAGWPATAVAFYSIAAALGFLHGFLLPRPSVLPVACGASAAALVLCVPVVLVTYGFALIGAPLILAYVLLVSASVYVGVWIRRRHARV